MSVVIEADGLTRRYRRVRAVDGVSFALEAGRVYGLLGRNGAGKTTLMHLLTGRTPASGGSVRLFGLDPWESSAVAQRVAFLPETQRYPDAFDARRVLAAAALMYPLWDAAYALRLAAEFRLPSNRSVKKLSRGQRSALTAIVGLASRAPITIFDEPTLGLDAVARDIFMSHLIEDASAGSRTVLLSTHLIDEVAPLLEHVLVIDEGRILIDQEAEALRSTAFTVAGRGADVDSFVGGRDVIARDALGALASATVLGTLTPVDRAAAAARSLEIGPVSLQQLVVRMTRTEPATSVA